MRQFRAIAYLGLVLILSVSVLYAATDSEELKKTLFSDVKTLIENAKLKKADLLSPLNFKEGEKAYTQALDDFNAGKNLDAIKKNIETASTLIKKASENIELSKLTLGKLIAARESAINAMALKYALENFKEGESLFSEAAELVENGNVTKARKIAERAEPIFKNAESRALKEGLLGDVKKLGKYAEDKDVKDYSPKLYKSASKKLRDSEAFIDSPGSDTDSARKKVEESRYDFDHSIKVAENVLKAKKDKMSLEDVYLDFEKNLEQISTILSVPVNFDKGIQYQEKAIIGAIERNNNDRDDLNQRLSKSQIEYENRVADLNQQITDKDKEIASLKGKTVSEAERLNTLKQKLEKENQAKEKYETVRSLFKPAEGQVLRDGDDIILQLYGVTFPSGKSTIEVDNYDLLAKVQKSIREFPGSRIVIEGHTDSVGDKKFNEILSGERAKAVMKYLISNNSIDEKSVSAVGFGDAKPVASNKIPEGRTKNRRIDIIIKTE